MVELNSYLPFGNWSPMFCLEQQRPVRHIMFLNVWSLVWINSINNPQSTVQSVLKVILAQPQLQVLLYLIASSWENVNMRDSWLPQLAVNHWIMQQMLRSYGGRNVGQDTGGLWDIPSSGGFKIVGKQMLPKYTVPSRISTVKGGKADLGASTKEAVSSCWMWSGGGFVKETVFELVLER